MKALKHILLFTLLIIFSCASTENIISSDFDNSIKFNQYSTFVICIDDLFVENTEYPNFDNNKVREIIGEQIENQMIDNGYETNVLRPELQAGFKLLITEEEVIFTNCDIQTEYDYWKTCTIKTEIYTRETLVIYVSDIKKNQIIWQASISCNMNKSKKNLEPYIKGLVERLFVEFPLIN